MAREIDSDFEKLKVFLESYSLAENLRDAHNLSVVKGAHKSYLPFLQLWAICAAKAKKNDFFFFGQRIAEEGGELPYLRETVSDTGSALFCCLHGAYKPGHMALRSSIENFLRFSVTPFNDKASTTTSVYELFELAKVALPFSQARAIYIGKLRSNYTELCKYTHSASLAHMAGVHALAHFPTFDKRAFDEWLGLARSCIKTMAAVILLGCPRIYHDSHYSSRELLELLVDQDERLLILKGAMID